jgi:hypothetical protein
MARGPFTDDCPEAAVHAADSAFAGRPVKLGRFRRSKTWPRIIRMCPVNTYYIDTFAAPGALRAGASPVGKVDVDKSSPPRWAGCVSTGAVGPEGQKQGRMKRFRAFVAKRSNNVTMGSVQNSDCPGIGNNVPF